MSDVSGGRTEKGTLLNIAKFLPFAIISFIFIIAGIVLLCNCTETKGLEFALDYTNCMNQDETATCREILNKFPECECDVYINITKHMEAPVTVYYKLDAYDEMVGSFASSRDDKQLSGDLSSKPSESCGEYSYANTTNGIKPIAPCGELADAMFNDTFGLHINNSYIESIHTGLLSDEDKKPYRNPPGDLELAFKDYAKPRNWLNNIWELDTKNASNNGFQNEAFIAWMKTDLKQKPAWRVNHTYVYKDGVPAGLYKLKVTYVYPPKRYEGPRIFIISNQQYIFNSNKYSLGIALLVIGLLSFPAILFLIYRKYKGKSLKCENMPFFNRS